MQNYTTYMEENRLQRNYDNMNPLHHLCFNSPCVEQHLIQHPNILSREHQFRHYGNYVPNDFEIHHRGNNVPVSATYIPSQMNHDPRVSLHSTRPRMVPTTQNSSANPTFMTRPNADRELVSLHEYTQDKDFADLWTLDDNSQEHYNQRQKQFESNYLYGTLTRMSPIQERRRTKKRRDRKPSQLSGNRFRKLQKKQKKSQVERNTNHTKKTTPKKQFKQCHPFMRKKNIKETDPDYKVKLYSWPEPG